MYFADSIDARLFGRFLEVSSDPESKQVVISILGWTGRNDVLRHLEPLAVDQRGEYSKHAVLSIVAIEKRIPFPRENFGDEYYDTYATKAVKLSQQKGIPLPQAAALVAEDLVRASAANN